MPAADVLGPDCGAYPDAFSKTDAGAHAVADARTDARTDDGDARAVSRTVRGTHTCSVAKTDDGRALSQAHASALLFRFVLERPDYGCYRLR